MSTDAYVRIDGIDSFDGISETPILLPSGGTYTAEIILQDSFGGLLSEAFANNGAGIQSTNVAVEISGGMSSGTGFTSTNATTEGNFFFLGSEDRPNGGLIRDGTGNVIPGANQGNPAQMVAPGIFEAVIGTFEFNFDPSEMATVATAWGGDNTDGFFNGIQADGPGGLTVNNLDVPRPGLINFRSATVVVPEPGSFLALSAGTVGVLLRRRRR